MKPSVLGHGYKMHLIIIIIIAHMYIDAFVFFCWCKMHTQLY